MNLLQHLLCKMAEECNEVGQMALKTAYFGLDEVYVDKDNRERTHIELDDLMAVIELLNEGYNFGYTPNRERIAAKKEKVLRYARYSETLGLLR